MISRLDYNEHTIIKLLNTIMEFLPCTFTVALSLTAPRVLAAIHVYVPLSLYWRLAIVSVPKLVVLTILLIRYFMLEPVNEVLIIILALLVVVLWNIQVILCCGNAIALHTNVTLLSSIAVVSTGASTISGGPT